MICGGTCVSLSPPLDLSADDIDNLVREPGNALVAQVNGDAGLLRLQIPLGIGGLGGAVVDVVAGLLEGGLCEGHDLVVGDGGERVVAHGERCGGRSQRAGEECLGGGMLVQV